MRADVGKVMMTPKGAYNPNTQYEIFDLVTNEEGSSYLAKAPSKGVPLTNTDKWEVLVDVAAAKQDVSDFKSASVNWADTTELFTRNAYIDLANKVVGDTTDFALTENQQSYGYIKQAVKRGDMYRLTCTGSNGARPWCFTDANGVILAIGPIASPWTATDQIIIAPDDGWLVVNAYWSAYDRELLYFQNANDLFSQVLDISDDINDRALIAKNINNEYVLNGYVTLTNLVQGDTTDFSITSSNSYKYIKRACKKGDIFILTTTGTNGARPWCFTDEDGVIQKIMPYSPWNVADLSLAAPCDGYFVTNANKAQTANVLYISRSYQPGEHYNPDIAMPWYGKKIVCFGDSRTWYDTRTYTGNVKSEWSGKRCIGYQEQLRNELGAIVVSQGVSGNTSAQICERIRAFDFTGYDAVLLEGGVNDFIKAANVTIGTLAPIGSTYDTATVYGAWQSAIEYIQTNYPSVKIFVTIPAIAWKDGKVFPYDVAKIKGEIARLYNLPVKNLYVDGMITEKNRDYYYVDDVESTGWHLHFNDYGNELIGHMLAGFIGGWENEKVEDTSMLPKVTEGSGNLLELPRKTYSVSNVTVTVTDKNHIGFSGTANASTGKNVPIEEFILPAGTYTLSAKYDTQVEYTNRTRMKAYIIDAGNATEYAKLTAGTPVTFTLNAETTVYFSVAPSSGTAYGYGFYVMLNRGYTAMPYEDPGEESAIDNTVRNKLLRRMANRNYAVEYANNIKPMEFVNIYGTIQNVHPKVLYFDQGFGGHRYWMAYTPYTNAATAEENPCIAYSDDGFEWTNIAGNPLATGTTAEYFSDTHLVYNPVTEKLECWYRLAVSTDPGIEYIYRRVSDDGLIWDDQELLHTGESGNKSHYLSPAVMCTDEGMYQIYVVSNKAGFHIEYYETSDATNWGTKARDISLTYMDGSVSYHPWHLDVGYIDGQYILLVMCKGDLDASPWLLFASTSSDNETYTIPLVVMRPDADSWDANMYRSCIVKTYNDYRIYYSARRQSVHGMGIAVADRLWKFIGIDLFE